MYLTGHKTRDVFERYNITSGADLVDAAKKLARFHGAPVEREEAQPDEQSDDLGTNWAQSGATKEEN
jgi:hypothetical protein